MAHQCITFRFLGHNLESSLKTIIEPLTFDLDTNYRLEYETKELPYTYNLVASKEFQIKQKANEVNWEKWTISNWLKLIVQKYLKNLKSKLLTIGVVFWIEFSFVKMEFFFPCWIPTEGSYVDTRTCEWYVLDNRVCRCKIMIHAFKRDNWMNSLSKRTVRDRVIFCFFFDLCAQQIPILQDLTNRLVPQFSKNSIK